MRRQYSRETDRSCLLMLMFRRGFPQGMENGIASGASSSSLVAMESYRGDLDTLCLVQHEENGNAELACVVWKTFRRWHQCHAHTFEIFENSDYISAYGIKTHAEVMFSLWHLWYQYIPHVIILFSMIGLSITYTQTHTRAHTHTQTHTHCYTDNRRNW